MDFKDTELFKVYVVLFFKNIAGSMIHLFSPVYLYVLGFPIAQIGVFLIFMSLATIGFLFLMGSKIVRLNLFATAG